MASATRGPSTVVVLGGSGALGRAVITRFRAAGWRAVSADLVPNTEAEVNVELPATWDAQVGRIVSASRDVGPVGAVVCTAGGWAGGSVARAHETVAAAEKMIDVCFKTALTSACVAAEVLAPGGLLVLTGSAAALGPTPGMVAYGMVKAATHHLLASVAAEGGGLPAGARAVGVLPVTIDTPANRAAMPGADTSTWTPPAEIAERVLAWTEDATSVASGALVVPETAAGVTTWKVVGK